MNTSLLSPLLVLLSIVLHTHAHWPHDTIDAMAVSPDESEIFAYTRNTLLKSVDSGASWQNIRSFTSFRKSYLALSPYDGTIYMYQQGIMFRSSDLINWDPLNITACQYEYHVNLKRRTAFVQSGGALIAGVGKLYKEDGASGFMEIEDSNFDNCPSLAGVPGSDIVYAGATNGLLKSTDGGITWDMVLPMSSIVEVKVQEGETFVITNSTAEGSICLLSTDEASCIDISLPEVAPADKVREGASQPTDLAYKSGTLTITRSNSYAIYYSKDLGSSWVTRVKAGAFETLGHQPDDAWAFDESEEFTHIEGNILGTWRGIFTTNDGGDSWKYRDTIRKAITTMSIMKASPENGGYFLLAVCTYVNGCYYGRPDNLTPNVGVLSTGYYFSLYFSPAYDKDQLRFERSEEILFRLEGSPNGTKVTLPELPKIDDGKKISIKSIDFSDNFETDSTMFVSGYNMGVLASYDKGNTFTQVFDGAQFGGVTKVILSPNWSTDGAMACLIDPNLNNMEWVILDDVQYIYVSSDFGATWRRLVERRPLRDFIIVAGELAPVIVAVDVKGRLWSHTTDLDVSNGKFRKIGRTNFANIRPQGFGYDGLAASPDGRTFAAAWAEGGMMLGEVTDTGNGNHTIAGRRWAKPHPWNPRGVPVVFARSPPRVDDVYGLRMFTSHIMFSPDYKNDRTIFAADMFSIYMSTNRGTNWVKVSTL